MFPIAAGLGALSLLNSLLQSTTAGTGTSQSGNPQSVSGQGFGDGDGDQSNGAPAWVGSGSAPPPFNSGMLAGLISLQGQQSGSGVGQISKTNFETTLAADGVDTKSADALFSKLDTNGDGTISQSELSAAHHGHHHIHAGGAMRAGLSSLLNATDASGAQSQTTTNADGSTTTTITYADGSKVTMTTPAASSSSNGGSTNSGTAGASPSNLVEQLIQLQSHFVTQATSSHSTIA